MSAVLPALLVLVAAAKVEAAEFHILGLRGDPDTLVYDVSADGTIAVGSYTYSVSAVPPDIGIHRVARRWDADGVPLSIGDFEGLAAGVSADGSVVVGQMGGNIVVYWGEPPTGEAFRWTSDGGAVRLGYLTEDVNFSYSSAFAISGNGSTVVGQSFSDSGYRAFHRTQAEGMVRLGILPGGTASSARNVSADGSVIVGSRGTDSADEAFRWTAEGGMVGLGRLRDHLDSYAEDVSADGSVVVGYSGNRLRLPPDPFGGEPREEDYEAFRWTEADGMVGLGYLPGHGSSKAYAVSADGSIVVGASYPVEYHGAQRSVGPPEAFIWDAEHGIRNLRDLLIDEYHLDLPDWSLGYPTGISADGKVIVGNGGNPGVGIGAAWMVVIPEPSSCVLAISGLAILLAFTWRRRRRVA